jgi:hypothetical protein
MSGAGDAIGVDSPASRIAAESGAGAWTMTRYLLVVVTATFGVLVALAWARPSIFTSIVVLSGFGNRFGESLPGTFYAERVAPILEENCAGCHGPRLQRARLRLDTLGDVRLGGKNGPVVVAGDPQASTLYTRLLLPRSDKRAMPAGNKPPLAKGELRVIELWIAAGASGSAPVDSIAGAPPAPSPPVVVEPLDAEAVAKARAPLEEKVGALSARYPDSIRYLSRDSAALIVDVQRLGADFDDADLAQFEPVAAAVSRLDLSGTAITDGAAPSLAAFVRLQSLRLNGTRVGDRVLTAVAQMPGLKTLTLVDTNASPERVTELRQTGLRVYDIRN